MKNMLLPTYAPMRGLTGNKQVPSPAVRGGGGCGPNRFVSLFVCSSLFFVSQPFL